MAGAGGKLFLSTIDGHVICFAMALNNKCLATVLAASLILSGVALACNVPVFRYALERWKPDACEVFVFCDRDFDVEREPELSKLMAQSREKEQ